MQEESERTNRDNYQPFFGTEEDSRLETQGPSGESVATTLRFPRPSSGRAGFYLAFRDEGTRVEIDRVILYYRVARGFSEPFISCPDVPLPEVGERSSLSCECIGETMGVESLERSCDSSGVCTDEGLACECSPGFEFNSTFGLCTREFGEVEGGRE